MQHVWFVLNYVIDKFGLCNLFEHFLPDTYFGTLQCKTHFMARSEYVILARIEIFIADCVKGVAGLLNMC